ncbi:hypothetical protein [Paenibacillus soyae]|uniref:Uncharacterized protein n=1 Tax=Paenibacillus soyae TaxID=2969249 RepID=A0A9X2MKG1_9BACL|nr:hypothetical protein [Paenibacillus soyae]MCR2803578.1 hypothetical protein [Paenibacillus soyae]
MFGWCAHVKIIKNEGTVIIGNIKQYAPSTNSVTNESSGSETGTGDTEAGVSGRLSRKGKRGRGKACRQGRGKRRAGGKGKRGKPWTAWTCG